MKEEFLHYVWQYHLYATTQLKTTTQDELYILAPGIYNTNTGPDFLQCELRLGDQKWVGNIEIHINASDWYAHRHELDPQYDAVILHVVWNYDVDVYMKNNLPIPTLELKSYVDPKLLATYDTLQRTDVQWIPCERQIQKIPSFTMKHWLERLFFERLEKKTVLVETLLKDSQNDWEYVLFQMFAMSFGSQVNGTAFLSIAQSVSIATLRKEWHDSFRLSALLFGQSGLLDGPAKDAYHSRLQREYEYLQHKYVLKRIHESLQFFRMRPHNFPTVRLAQFVGLYAGKKNVFSSLMALNKIEDLYQFFAIAVAPYWQEHFNFGKTSRKTTKKLTRSFIDLLILNTILPVKFYYEKSKGTLKEDELIALMSALKPEKNKVLSRYSALGVEAENALESQALLELSKYYCTPKHCLRCAIGKTILDQSGHTS